MESTANDVRQIKTKLHTSRQQLHTLDEISEKTIKSNVDGIQTSLKTADRVIENVHEKTSVFVLQLEDISNASSLVNIQPQMSWLHDELGAIIQDFESAQRNAREAINSTDEYRYKVMDVKSEVEVNSSLLTQHQQTAERLLAEAKRGLTESEDKISSAYTRISSNEGNIKTKTSTIVSKNQKKADLQKQVASKRAQMNQARSEQKDRKGQAIASGGLALAGIFAAPFTGGASLLLTAAAGGTSVYKVDRMLDFEREADELYASVSQVDNEISTLTSAVANLENETTKLRADIQVYRSEIREKQAEMRKLEQQIKNGDETKKEIGTVKNHAASTLVNVQKALPDLRDIRNSLEHCGDLIEQKRLDVSSSTDLTSRFAGMVPFVGTKLKRKNEYKKQMLVIEQVLQTLDKIHKDMPTLLPASNSKFLDIKPWNSAQVSLTEMREPIPNVVWFD